MIAIGRSRILYDSLIFLIQNNVKISAIVTDRAYDEYDIKEKDFEELAAKNDIKFFLTSKPQSNVELINIINELDLKIAISVNWKFKLPKSFLDLFCVGILNLHIGELPDYKGNATPNWAIINDLKITYACVHKMSYELDAGDVISREPIIINNEDYICDLWEKTIRVAPMLYLDAINKLKIDRLYFLIKGSGHGIRCYPRLPEDSKIDWNLSTREIYNLVRASSKPYSGAYCIYNSKILKIWKCKEFYPNNKFYAIPGHVVALNLDGSVSISTKDGFIILTEISYDGVEYFMNISNLLNSIRLRLN